MAIRSSSSLFVLSSALTIFTSTAILGLDYARLGPIIEDDTEGDSFKTFPEMKGLLDTSDKSFVTCMTLGAILFIVFKVPINNLRSISVISQLSLAATVVVAGLFSPGYSFIAFRAIQGAIAANAITLAMVSVAQASNKNSAWRFVPLAIALYSGTAMGLAHSAEFSSYSASVGLVIGCLAAAALTWFSRHKSELRQGAASLDIELENEISSFSGFSLKETLSHVPQFGQNIIRMTVVAFAMGGSTSYVFAAIPVNISDEQFDALTNFEHQTETGSFVISGPRNLTDPADIAQWDSEKAGIRSMTWVFFIFAKFVAIVVAPAVLECLGAYAVKRWNIRYNAPIALLLLLPAALLEHISKGRSEWLGGILAFIGMPIRIAVSFLMRIYTPILSQLNTSCYSLGNVQKTHIFALVSLAFSSGILLSFLEIDFSGVPVLGHTGVLLLIIAAADFVPDVVSKIKKD